MAENAYKEYCRQVRSALKKATQKERASFTEELLDHMESHAETLMELGWEPEEARDYSVQAMGDPVMVGRQYDEKLSSFWLWAGRVLSVCAVILAICVLSGTHSMYGSFLGKNLEARQITEPYRWVLSSIEGRQWGNTQLVDIEIPLEKHTIRIYGVELVYFGGEVYQCRVYLTGYSHNPFDPNFKLLQYASIEGFYGGGGDSYWSSFYYDYYGNVEAGQESLMFRIQREFPYMDVCVEIPLDWEGLYE